MKIKAIEKYVFDNKEFNTLKDVQNHIHNIIGEEIIDKINRKIEIRHKDLFTLLEIFCTPEVRDVFLKTLNVTFTYEDEDNDKNETTINILDIK